MSQTMPLADVQRLWWQVAMLAPPEALPALPPPFAHIAGARLRQYAFMVYANHADTLSVIYPYCAKVLGDAAWESTVRAYLTAHPPGHYQLYHTATGFPGFLETHHVPYQPETSQTAPFLPMLAQYELLEATLLRCPQPLVPEVLGSALWDDLDRCVPVPNRVAQPLTTPWQLDALVSRIQAMEEGQVLAFDDLYTPETPLYLWVYRDAGFQCRFFKVNALIQTFLGLLLNSHNQDDDENVPVTSCNTLMQCACAQVGLGPDALSQAELRVFLEMLVAQGILLGASSIPETNEGFVRV
jgi:hypothetical protein